MKRYRKRRIYKRKRRFFKKRYAKKRVYDRGVALKCHVINDVTYNTTYSAANVSINWGGNGNATNTTIKVSQSDEYVSHSTLYTQWRMIGVKIRFHPLVEISGTNTALQEGYYCGQVAVLPSETTNAKTILGSDYFKSFPLDRPFTKYINTKKYFTSINQRWLDLGAYYDTAGSILRLFMTGFANGVAIGRIHCTYYVRMRGQKS